MAFVQDPNPQEEISASAPTGSFGVNAIQTFYQRDSTTYLIAKQPEETQKPAASGSVEPSLTGWALIGRIFSGEIKIDSYNLLFFKVSKPFSIASIFSTS